jgi:hypothetical protein
MNGKVIDVSMGDLFGIQVFPRDNCRFHVRFSLVPKGLWPSEKRIADQGVVDAFHFLDEEYPGPLQELTEGAPEGRI